MPTPLTDDVLRERCAKYGATFTSRDVDAQKRTTVSFSCSCGTPVTGRPLKRLSDAHPALCSTCSETRRRQSIADARTSQGEIERLLAFTGATFISRESQPGSGTLVRFQCACGTSHSIWTGHLTERQNARCPVCAHQLGAHPSRANHPRWVSDRTKLAGKYPWGTEDLAWSREVLQRYSYRCFLTGEEGKLSAHHLYSRTLEPKLRFVLENGVAISPKFHRQFHAKYGMKGFTALHFVEFAAQFGKHFDPSAILAIRADNY